MTYRLEGQFVGGEPHVTVVYHNRIESNHHVDHHNENIWAVGKNGEYILQQPIENVELDAIKESTYFAALAHSEDNLQVYEDYFDAYTCES